MHWGSKMDWMRHSMTTFLVFDIVTTRGTSLITGITAEKITNKSLLDMSRVIINIKISDNYNNNIINIM